MRAAISWLVFAAGLAACGGDQELALLPKGGQGDAAATGGGGGAVGDAGTTGGSGGCTASECSGETPFCHSGLGRCVRCLVANHCENGQACDPAGECRPPCSSEAQCTSDGKHCDLVTGACVECRSASATDCTSGDELRCVLGQCRQCAEEKDCASQSQKVHCLIASGECVECLGDGNCGAGQTCDPTEHQCKGG